MKKATLIAAAMFLMGGAVFAQNNYRSVDVSIVHMENTWQPSELIQDGASTNHQLSLQVDANLWRLGNHATLGLYGGAWLSSYFIDYYTGNASGLSVQVRGGVRAQLHLLPLMNVESDHFDVAASATVGNFYCQGTTLQTEFGVGLSVAYYPIRWLGLKAECNWGRYSYASYSWTQWWHSHIAPKVGLSIRF